MPLTVGTRLGPYEILALLGAGGMGEVYRAKDTRLDRIVAIKVLSAQLAGQPEVRQRFEREARAISSLSHPHICSLFDVGHQDGTDFLVMEYLEGETLARRLEQGPLPLEQLLRTAVEMTDALDKAHRQGVVHRDLKPGNIMLTKAGAKLLDFGLAKAVGLAVGADLSSSPTQSQPITAAGTIVGTYQYMAPEQLEGKEADARSDIFTFGAVLYEMATAQKAFQGKSHASLIAAILKEEPRPLSTLQPMTPPALERVVKTCLAKDPDERFQTAHDLKLQLDWISEAGSQAGVPAPVVARRRTREQVSWALVAILAALSGVLGVLYFRSVSTEVRPIRAFIPAPEKTSFHFVGLGAGPVSVSPDGSKLAFVAQRADGTDLLWVRAIDSLVGQPLAGTEGADYPFWSPDSRSLGFFAGSKLKRIEAAGGPPLTLCEAPDGRGGTWSPEGEIVFAPGAIGPLHRVSAAGGASTPLTKLDEARKESTHRWPWFLPDGRHFLYFARIGGGGSLNEGNAIMVGSLDGPETKLLLRTQANAAYAPAYLLYLRDNTLMAQPFDAAEMEFTGEAFPIAEKIQYDKAFSQGIFSVSGNGVLAYQTGEAQAGSQLLWFDRAGKQLSSLGDQAMYYNPRLSPDRKWAAVDVTDPRFGPPDIWIYDVARGLRTRFTFEATADRIPVWSPDGSRIAFASIRKGRFDLYQKSFTGSGVEEILFESDLGKTPSSWSPDGRYLAFSTIADPKTKDDLWILPLFGDRKPFVFLQTHFSEYDGRFSPDGRWIGYVSDESGRQEVYVAPFPGPGRKWQVSTNGGSQPRWRRDGKEIFYLDENNRIVAVEVNSKGATFEVGAAKVLFETRPQRLGATYDVSADGQRFLVNTAVAVQTSDPMTLVVNWTADLKKK